MTCIFPFPDEMPVASSAENACGNHTYIYIYTYIHRYINVYTYSYTYIHIHIIYIYIHTYIFHAIYHSSFFFSGEVPVASLAVKSAYGNYTYIYT